MNRSDESSCGSEGADAILPREAESEVRRAAAATPAAGEILVDRLDALEAVLAEMWRASEDAVAGEGAGQDAGGAGGVAEAATGAPADARPVRLCMGNVAVVTEPAREAEVLATLDLLGARVPARVIVAVVDDAPAEVDGASVSSERADSAGAGPIRLPIRASIRALCLMPEPGRPSVCCEQIRLAVPRGDAGLLPGIVTPLLEPDIPSVLWWDRPQTGLEEVLHRLAAETGRVVADLDRVESVQAVVALRAAEASLHDLTWASVEPWRRALARVFDDAEMRPRLRRIAAVTLQARDPGPRPPAAALLLLGWLAAQLGWRVGPLVEDEGLSLGVAIVEGTPTDAARVGAGADGGASAGGTRARVKLKIRTSPDFAPIESISIRCDEGSEIRLERARDCDRIRVAVKTPSSSPPPSLAGGRAPGTAAVLAAALESASAADRVHARALERALALAGI